MAYKIQPDRDWHVVEEFRQNPIGCHSPSLMRVLNTLRFDPSGNQTILVATKIFEKWILGMMPPDRSDPIVLFEDEVFNCREDAEWAVFCKRWEAHTGQRINSPRSAALSERPPC